MTSGNATDSTLGQSGPNGPNSPNTGVMPEVTFSTFVLSLASSALVQMGEVPNPETGLTEQNPELARNTIDMLRMLQEKTANGLTPEESRLLSDVLYELRMKFVVRS